MNRLTRHITALMLALTLGLHWTVLQSLAWVNMLVSYSAEDSFGEAVVRTFDGHHPCQLCVAVAAGRQTGRNDGDSPAPGKADGILAPESITLIQPPSLPVEPGIWLPPVSFFPVPPTPPPRSPAV